MTDMTEPWPPVPGPSPATSAGPPGPPPSMPPEPPPAFQGAPARWAQQPAVTPPTLGSPYTAAVPPLAEHVVPAPTPAASRRGRGGLAIIVALIVVGLVGVLGGGALLAKELTRKATTTEQAAALAAEVASRWQRLPAGKIFPASISYANSDGVQVTMTRVAIVPQASCRSALEPSAFQQIRRFGCNAMLRATYIDAAGTQAVTAGIAVFPSGLAASRAQSALEAASDAAGLYAVPITGTIANTFGNAQRAAGDAQFTGTYVLFFTAGYTDGMPASAAATNNQLVPMGDGILVALESALSKHTSACAMKDIKC